MRKIKLGLALMASISATGCASIVNDPTVPLSLAFSDGSSGACNISNTRAAYQVEVPGTQMVRRARSPLTYTCKTNSGKSGTGSIPSSIEGAKLGASILFLDLGITDSITEKARTYPTSFVVPVK